jgi:hypothetical protein
MKQWPDCFGNQVRLTDERLKHILQHTEMTAMAAGLEKTLRQPKLVRVSRSDSTVRLFYTFHAETMVGGKWLCLVVKYLATDAFVVTAYLTDKPKEGTNLWPKK